MKAFRIKGTFRMGRDDSPFTMETADTSEEDARERVLSTLGSRHRVRRGQISIEDVEEIDPDDVESETVLKRLREA